MKVKKPGQVKSDIRVILHDIRSAHNVGSMFRTADAAGIAHIYLSGYTPAPLDRFKRPRKDIAKVALGAEKTIPWTAISEVADAGGKLLKLLAELKKQGFTIVAVEQNAKSVDYKKVFLPNKAVIIVGNEVDGISPGILKQCDLIVEIPMRGKKESLNVSVAFGVALFKMLGI